MKNTFVRFILVGIANTIVGLSVIYVLLHLAGLSYWTATFLGNSVGACVSFLLNRNFTFQSQGSVRKSMIRFILVILSCYLIAYNLGTEIIDLLLSKSTFIPSHYKTDVAVLISTCLYTILNYFCQKLFVFPRGKALVIEKERM